MEWCLLISLFIALLRIITLVYIEVNVYHGLTDILVGGGGIKGGLYTKASLVSRLSIRLFPRLSTRLLDQIYVRSVLTAHKAGHLSYKSQN
jgi:hypothetical protein